MTTVPSSTSEAVPEGFGDVGVELSLCAVYLAARLDDQSHPALTQALHLTLRRKGIDQDRVGLIRQARGGMPDAIVPFHRQELDVYFAAALLAPENQVLLRGSGNAVEVGYFHCDRGSLKYVDTFERPTGFSFETLNMANTQGLLRKMRAWTQRPTVQVGSFDGDDFLRVYPGTDAFLRKINKVIPKGEPGDEHHKATISLLRLTDSESGPLVNRVAWGNCHMRLSVEGLGEERGDVHLDKSTGGSAETVYRSIEIVDVKPELAMELHAGWLAAQDDGKALWLHVSIPRADFFSQTPDLLSPGATTEGWFAPFADIGRGLGASPEVKVRLPRWVAIELMRRHRWLWSRDWPEWVRWGWSLNNT